MRVWHRLYVFAQLLIVLSVIGNEVPVAKALPWPVTNFAASNTSDTSVEESSTTSEVGITENFEELKIAEQSTIVSTASDYQNDFTTVKPEVTWRTEALLETATTNSHPKKKTEHSMLFAARSLDIEVDFDNVIETSGVSTINSHRNMPTTQKPQPQECIFIETAPTSRNLNRIQNHTPKTTTIISKTETTETAMETTETTETTTDTTETTETTTDTTETTETTTDTTETTEESETIVRDLRILGSTSKTLTISWKRKKIVPDIQHYEVQWYQKELLVGSCRIFNEKIDHAVRIESLNPCTTYHVTVQPVVEIDMEAIATINGTTDLEVNEDSVKLRVAGVGSDWIEISWTMPCTDCVSSYTINVCKTESEKCVVAEIDKTTYNITDLIPGGSYNFELTIEGIKGVYGSLNITSETTIPKPEIKDCDITIPNRPMNYLEGSSPALFQNLDTEPSKFLQAKEGEIIVEGLKVVDTEATALTVSWKKPNGTRPNGSLEVSYYIIEWFEHDEAVSTCKVSNETFFYHITSLASCTTYTVNVKPHLEAANGTKRVVSGTTGLNVHKDTLDLNVAGHGPDWLKISWNMPSTDCVTHYIVDFCDGGNCTEYQTNNTTYYEKKNLNPCTTYDYRLTVYGSSAAYGSLNISGTTDFVAPGKPSPATTESGDYSLFVSWPKPEGHTCIKHYRVVWSRDGRSGNINTENNFQLLEGLDPCATYEIIITAVNIKNGDSPQERIQSNITSPAITDKPVLVSGPFPTDNTISISWKINTNETNNCLPSKLIVECQWREKMGSGYDPVNGRTEYNISEDSMDEKADTTVKKISPFTKYDCYSYTINLGGRSENSFVIETVTHEAVPWAPVLLPESSTDVTNTSIRLQWKKPAYLPGILRTITIEVIWSHNWSHEPDWCTTTYVRENITDIDGNVTEYEYSATPFSRYRVKIFVATGAGWGPASEPQSFNTKAGAPGEVTALDSTLRENSKDPNILEGVITWGTPCFFNGHDIEYFEVFGAGERNGFEPHSFTKIVNYTNSSNDSFSLTIDELREEHTYSIEVAAKNVNFTDLGVRSHVTIEYPAGIPPQPNENYTSIISIDPYKARRTTETAAVLLPLFPDTKGTIKCYAIIVSKIGYNNGSFGRIKDNTQPATATWAESKELDFQIPYEATRFGVDKLQSLVADYGRFKAVKFVLGEDTETCPEISSNERSYCNGPLNPDTVYHVRMRAFTAGGYRDSKVFTVKTNAELQVAVVIGTIFGILFLGILMTMMLLVRRCSLQAVLRRFLHSDMPGSPVPAPFTRRKFIAHCQQLADNPGKLSNEYQLLQTLSVDLQMPTNAACLQANRKKNRYTDILPYDFSRVKLEVIDNDPNTDYINASFIKGFTGEEDYIACQGPKEETTYDFWRMIDQYDIKLIVMLTQLVEKNKEKCHQYFPTIRETFTYENMAIRCSSELDYRTYTQRTLVLQKENSKRTIIHLHFKDWPDHDVPEDFDPMINFCQIMRRHMEASRGLVVIHCSAGIGRTGTLIAIDILLQHIKDNRKLDVFGTVYRLRHHRINMVQRESQYAYIYNCIRQVLKNPYFSKTYKPPSVDPIGDNNSHKKKEASESNTDLVSSFETLKKSSFSTSEESAVPIYQSPKKTSPKSRTCYSLSGLRCAKSTGAIDTRPHQQTIGRYNTLNHPISEIANDSPVNSSEISLDITDSEGSTASIYENMQPLPRSKSTHVFEQDEDLGVTQKLLEHDTSL